MSEELLSTYHQTPYAWLMPGLVNPKKNYSIPEDRIMSAALVKNTNIYLRNYTHSFTSLAHLHGIGMGLTVSH
jgi:hypothetical protein